MDIRFMFKSYERPNGLQDFVRSELRKRHIQEFIDKKFKRSVVVGTEEDPNIMLTFSTTGGTHTATFDFQSKSGRIVQVAHTSNDLYEAVGYAADKLSQRIVNS